MHKLFSFLILLLAVCVASQDAEQVARRPRALLIALPAAGHMNPLLGIGQELLKRGYNVSVAMLEDTLPIFNLKGFNYISLGKSGYSIDDFVKHSQEIHEMPTIPAFVLTYQRLITPWMHAMYDNVFADLSRFSDFDVIVEDAPSLMGSDLAYTLDKPCISVNPSVSIDFNANIPSMFSGYGKRMTYVERLMNTLYKPGLVISSLYGMMEVVMRRSSMNLPAPDFELGICTRLNIAGVGLDYPKPTLPHIFSVGPLISFPLAPLSAPLQKWLDDELPENGGSGRVVLIAMGTSVQLEKWQIHTLIDAARNQNMKVIFALSTPNLNALLPDDIPENVRIEPFLQQKTVLNHPAVKVFLSHCGMGSAQESLYLEKPILAMPFHFDQPDVAARIIDAGAGLIVNRYNFTAAEVTAKLLQIMDTPSFTQAAKRISAMYKIGGGVTRAGDIVDFVRQFGSQQFHPMESELPWYQAKQLDVIGTLLLAVYAIYWLLRRCCCNCCCRKAAKKSKKAKCD